MVKVLNPPGKEPVSVNDFKAWMQGLPITAEQEPMVLSLLQAGREEAERYTNRALCEQTLQVVSDLSTVVLPRPAYRGLKDVSDESGNDVTERYEVDDTKLLAELHGEAGKVTVIYTAGCEEIPEKAKQAILLYATWGWMHRGGDLTIPPAFYALLSKERVIPV
mgnify:FL=1